MAETVSSPGTHIYDLTQQYLTNGAVQTLSTGFRRLDETLGGGFCPGSIYVVGGRPGEGKSSLALSIARRMAFDHKRRVIYLSLEMTAQELIERAICQTTRKPFPELKKLRDTGQLEALLTPFLALCQQSSFKIEDDRGATKIDLMVLLEENRTAQEPLPEIIIIDHLQHQLFTEGMNRADAIANYLADLKMLAKRENIVFLVCSQLNREVYKEKGGKIQLHHLKSSGAIEEVADCVMLCHKISLESDTMSREEQSQPTEFKIIIAKHRRGPLDELTMTFHPTIYEFEEPEGSWAPKAKKLNLDEIVSVV